jgi:hypothetical protein
MRKGEQRRCFNSHFQLKYREPMIVPRTARTIAVARIIAGLAGVLMCAPTHAHDIPNDVAVQIFLKPVGERLQLLMRVPLRALRDVEFPQRGPAFLDLARADGVLRDAAMLWLADTIELYEGETRLPKPQISALRVALEADKSFASYEAALAHVTGARLPDSVEVPWNQALLDVLFEYPIESAQSEFSIHPETARLGLRVMTALRFLPPGGAVRAFEFTGDPGLVRLDPRLSQAALRFVEAGFFHILDGLDHLLFLFCLVIPLRRLRPLVVIVTAFTVAHSLTLIASAYNLAPDALWFPPLIETLIAVSIVYLALENIIGGAHSLRRRWIMAFGFGLAHGFGFSFALRETLQFAGSHLLASLLSFNLGVEFGQLFVLALLVPALALLFRFVIAERIGTIILSALVAHTGWHWMTERGDQLRQFAWPAFTAGQLAAALRWLMLIVLAGGLFWLALARIGWRRERSDDSIALADEK